MICLLNSLLHLTAAFQDEINSAGHLQYSHVTADKVSWMPKHNLIEKAAQSNQDPDDPGDESFFSIFQPQPSITTPATEGANKNDDFDREMALAHVFDFGLEIKRMVRRLFVALSFDTH